MIIMRILPPTQFLRRAQRRQHKPLQCINRRVRRIDNVTTLLNLDVVAFNIDGTAGFLGCGLDSRVAEVAPEIGYAEDDG